MARVFLSYSKHDRSMAARLVKEMEARGHQVWWDYRLIAGMFFRASLDQELKDAQVVVVLWTKNSIKSEWVQSEVDQAYGEHKLVCTRARDLPTVDIPKPFSSFHTASWDEFDAISSAIDFIAGGGLPQGIARLEERHATRANVLDRIYWKVIEASEDEADFRDYLYHFPTGQFASHAKHKLSYLEYQRANAPPPPPPPDPNQADSLSRVIMLLNGHMDHGGPFWCYVAIKPSMFEAFKVAEREGAVDLYNFEEFGEVIVSAEGDWPPYEVTKKVGEMYGSDADSFFGEIDPLKEIGNKIAQLNETTAAAPTDQASGEAAQDGENRT